MEMNEAHNRAVGLEFERCSVNRLGSVADLGHAD